ncbi:MAG: haloacid dehalogenase-like hydrolase [Myxococcales bacterium]|nr:haloacid dehalogenase-like hydrolase [Myxococcales bacterium]HQY64547.1 haloacid dehalogenase-like hydrolase [Polyangiaceae bacterium]
MGTARSALFGESRRGAHSGAGVHTRLVERFRVHGAPIDFRELCLRAVPTSTRLLVLDLDRTVHLDRNMGELLGWEIAAHLGYGPEYLADLEPTRAPGRMFLAPSRPLSSLRYLARAVALWGPPGLFYLVWGKLAWGASSLRRSTFRRFGPEPVRAVQRVPQHALLHQLAALPRATVRELATRVLRRHAADQTLDRADLDWLRARCPGLRVVLSSASPRPIVEAAAAELGADDFLSTEVEELEDGSSAPCDLSRLGRPLGAPGHISRPSRQRINAGPAKLEALCARYPDLLDPEVESVGMTDTGYGEDHSWTELFRTVIDVNSTAPFPPVVSYASPTRAVHSALLLTRAERDGAPPRLPTAEARELSARELGEVLGGLPAEIEALAGQLAAAEAEHADARDAARAALLAVEPELEATVERYNDASPRARPAELAELGRLLAQRDRLGARIVEIERPLSDLAFALTVALEAARASLTRPPAAPTPSMPLAVAVPHQG